MTVLLAMPGGIRGVVVRAMSSRTITETVEQVRLVEMVMGNNAMSEHQRNGEKKQKGYICFAPQIHMTLLSKYNKRIVRRYFFCHRVPVRGGIIYKRSKFLFNIVQQFKYA